MKNKNTLTLALFSVTIGASAFFFGTSVSKASNIDGMKLYLQHCKTCHGVDGNPTDLGEGWVRVNLQMLSGRQRRVMSE